jgi:hypothetical protein
MRMHGLPLYGLRTLKRLTVTVSVEFREKDAKIAILGSKIKNSKHSSVYFSTLSCFSIVPNIGVFPK